MRERNEYLCSCRIYIQTEGRGKQSTTKLTISLPEGDTHYGDKNIEKEDSKVAGKAQYGGEFYKPSNRKTRARGLLQIQRLIWDTQRIQGSPGPHSKILSKQTSKSPGGGIMCCTQYRGSEQAPQRRLKTLCQHCEDSIHGQCEGGRGGLRNLPEAMVQGQCRHSGVGQLFSGEMNKSCKEHCGRETEAERVAQARRARREGAFQHPPLTKGRDF